MLKSIFILLSLVICTSAFSNSNNYHIEIVCKNRIYEHFQLFKCDQRLITTISFNHNSPEVKEAVRCYTKGNFKVYNESNELIYDFSNKDKLRFHGKRSISSHFFKFPKETETLKFIFEPSTSPVGITKFDLNSYSFLQSKILVTDIFTFILAVLLIISGFYTFAIGSYIKINNILPLSIFSIFVGIWTFYTRDAFTRSILIPFANPHAFDWGIISAYTAFWGILKFFSSLPFGPLFRRLFFISSIIAISFAAISIFLGLIYIPIRFVDPYFNFFTFCVLCLIVVGIVVNKRNLPKLQFYSISLFVFGGLWDASSYLICKAFPQFLTTSLEGFHLLHFCLLLSVNIFFISLCKSRLLRSKVIPSIDFLNIISHEIKNLLYSTLIQYQDTKVIESETISEIEHTLKFLENHDHVHKVKKERFRISEIDETLKEIHFCVFSDKKLTKLIITNLIRNAVLHGEQGSIEIDAKEDNDKIWLTIQNRSPCTKKFSRGWGLNACYYLSEVLGERLILSTKNGVFTSNFSISKRSIV